MSNSIHPKVFVSHASEDKNRFVINFATRLRNRGVDAWLDKWEIGIGDSLVDKIFEEGLKEADAIIIVLSKVSINKPWVREELSSSVVAKIQNGTKLLPVLIDDCEVPVSLKHLVWEQIQDLQEYDESFEKIVSSIFGVKKKPKLGNPPSFLSKVFEELNQVEGLQPLDNFILKKTCEFTVKQPYDFVSLKELVSQDEDSSISKHDLLESLDILESDGYLDVHRAMNLDNWECDFRPTLYGFQEYCVNYLDGYDKIIDKIAADLVNIKAGSEGISNHELEKSLSLSIYIIDHVLKLFENNELIRLEEFNSGKLYAWKISPKLKRALQ